MLPATALAAPAPAAVEPASGPAFDTPEPREERPNRNNRNDRNNNDRNNDNQNNNNNNRNNDGQGSNQPVPTDPPAFALGALPVAIGPARDELVVGYYESGVLGQLPLLVAQLGGYLEDAGFTDVTLVEVPDTLTDVTNGDLDFAVVPSRQAHDAFQAEPLVPAIAGYQNYDGEGGAYGGDLLVATPGLVEHEPTTVIAFLSAYIRALKDLGSPDSAAEALELIQSSALAVDPEVAGAWDESVSIFAPFDGGFGSLSEESGLGELAAFLADSEGDDPEVEAFVAAHTLNIAQVLQELVPNPDSGLVGAPSIVDISIGLPLDDLAISPSPITVAADAGYFTEAGFASVQIMDVEQPLLGLLNGELEFGVVDAVDAADGVNQGLPVAAIAGHQNYGDGGDYGGNVVLASDDLLADDPTTATAFLIAYLRGLQDLTAGANTTTYAPYDGGFGSPDMAGGGGELTAYLTEALGQAPELEAFVAIEPLHFAQAWIGLPADPTSAPLPPTQTLAPIDAPVEAPAEEGA